MTNSTDRVLNLSIQSNGETNQAIELVIESTGLIAGKMGALINIDNDSAVELLVQTIHIDGDLGQAGATVADRGELFVSDISDISDIRVDGDWYAKVNVDNTHSGNNSNTFFGCGGEIISGILEYQNGTVTQFRNYEASTGGMTGSVSNPVSVKGSGQVLRLSSNNDATEVNISGFIDPNNAPNILHPEVNLISVRGDFQSSTPQIYKRLGGLPNLLDNGGGLAIDGDFDADMTVNEILYESNPDDTSNFSKMTIGDSMVTGSAIRLVDEGLTVQIVINNNNNGGVKNGTVYVDGNALDEEFAELPSDLGGGSVGVVPYNYHKFESSPQFGSTTSPSTSLSQVDVFYYGPIIESDPSALEAPVILERAIALYPAFCQDPCDSQCPTPNWVDISSGFDFDIIDNTTNSAWPTRQLRISPKAFNGGTFSSGFYRVRPNDVANENHLACNLLRAPSAPAVTIPRVKEHALDKAILCEENYWFEVSSFDKNQNGQVESGDVPAWMLAPEDYNADSTADSEDLIILLEAINEN